MTHTSLGGAANPATPGAVERGRTLRTPPRGVKECGAAARLKSGSKGAFAQRCDNWTGHEGGTGFQVERHYEPVPCNHTPENVSGRDGGGLGFNLQPVEARHLLEVDRRRVG